MLRSHVAQLAGLVGLGLVVGSIGCQRRTDAPPQTEAPAKAPDDPAPARPSALQRARDAVTDNMDDHFARARHVHDGLVEGDLARVKEAARSLSATRPKAYPEPWMPYILRLQGAAERTAAAADLEGAATKAADMLLACGQCHEALGKGPAFSITQPPNGDDSAAVMARHGWGAHRLWESLVGPSEQHWAQGVDALGDVPACQADPGGEQSQDVAKAMRARLESLAPKAKAATDSQGRAAAYGEVLSTCGACHLSGC